jgi:hypothetical protein
MAELTGDVRPVGTESAVVYAPFDKAQKKLKYADYSIISLAQNAQIRMEQGAGSDVSRSGNYVREGVIYVPNGTPRLVRHSPVLKAAEKATKAHRQGKEFFPTKAQLEEALSDSVDFPNQNTNIPTNRFDEEELTVYAFGNEEQARSYGEFLREAGIKEMPVWIENASNVNKQSKPFTRQLWLSNLDDGSILDGYIGGNGYRVRGVSQTTGVASSHSDTKAGESGLMEIR